MCGKVIPCVVNSFGRSRPVASTRHFSNETGDEKYVKYVAHCVVSAEPPLDWASRFETPSRPWASVTASQVRHTWLGQPDSTYPAGPLRATLSHDERQCRPSTLHTPCTCMFFVARPTHGLHTRLIPRRTVNRPLIAKKRSCPDNPHLRGRRRGENVCGAQTSRLFEIGA
jgi:hypothetical protein